MLLDKNGCASQKVTNHAPRGKMGRELFYAQCTFNALSI